MSDCSGRVRLRERGTKDEHDTWTSIELLDESTDIELDVADRENIILLDDEGINETIVCSIGLNRYHVENTETKRAFHADLHAYLNKEQLQQLHNYIGFLLGVK